MKSFLPSTIFNLDKKIIKTQPSDNIKELLEKHDTKCIDDTEKQNCEGPDEGWAWVVAFAACMINFIMAGLSRISGILFMALIEIYGVDRKSASMPFSVRASAGNLFGPVVGILGQKYGARKVIITGAIIGVLSCSACFFAPNVTWITVLYGGLSGVGAALTVTLPQVVIGQHFEKYRTTAVGIAFSGGCFGSFIFPVILENVLPIYGIQGTFLIIGAIIMHCIPAALILRKPSWLKTDPQSNGNIDKTLNELQKKGNVVKAKDLISVTSVSTPKIVTPGGKASEFISVTSVNECTPNSYTPDVFRSQHEEMASRLSVRSVNECTPRKSTPRASRTASDVYPDIKLLKENSDIVKDILNMESAIPSSKELKHEEFDTMGVVEDLCMSLRFSKGAQYYRNLRSIRNSLFSNESEIMSPISPKFNFSFDRKMSELQLPSVDAPPTKVIDEYSKQLVLNKLSELYELEDKDFTKTLEKHLERGLLILAELRKLHKLCPRVKDSISSEVFEETKNVVVTKDAEVAQQSEVSSEPSKVVASKSFLNHIQTAFKLYVNPMFIMVCLCRAVHFITFIPAMTTVVDFVIGKGIPEEEGKYAIAAISVGDLVGRLCLGWVTDRGYMTLARYMMVVMIMQGMSTASLPLMDTHIALFANLAVFGMLQGSLFVRHSVLISKYMKKDEQSIAMGCVNFISGFIGFGLPLYIGYFRDTMGSYDLVFFINGLIGMSIGLLWAFEPCFVRFVNAKRETEKIVT